MAQARIVFHLPARHLSDWRDVRYLAMFRRIAEVFEPLGAQIVVRDRRDGPFQGGETGFYDDGDLHLLDTGRARGPGVLNTSIAYLPPFWHLDPIGVQAESSIGARDFDPDAIPLKPALAFFDRMRARYTLARKSRRGQQAEVTHFPPGAISVFLQGSHPQDNGLAYATGTEMLRAVVAGAGGRLVLVKPHPLALEQDSAVIARAMAEGLSLTPTTANVTDMIAASDVTVSIGSACALEGFLQRKPAILFGPTDFHHLAQTLHRPEGFAPVLHAATNRPEAEYERFLYWYFVRNCVNVTAPEFAQKVLTIFAQSGFPPDRLGIVQTGR
jgi:hypothetical protein